MSAGRDVPSGCAPVFGALLSLALLVAMVGGVAIWLVTR